MAKTSYLMPVVVVLALGGAAAGAWHYTAGRDSAKAQTATIPTGEVRREQFLQTVASLGATQAAVTRTVESAFNGKIKRIVPEGTVVREGQPILWMESTDLERELSDMQSALDLAIKQLESQKEDLALTERTNAFELQAQQTSVELAERKHLDARQKFESERVLVERGISPASKGDEAQLALLQAELSLRNARIDEYKLRENLDSRLKIARTAVERAQLEVDRARNNRDERRKRLDNAVLKAPVAGEVTYLRIWKNGTSGKIAEGDQVWENAALIEIPAAGEMLAIVPVHELDVSRVQQGQRAEVVVEALPGRVFQGTVVARSNAPVTDSTRRPWDSSGQSTGPREFEVRIALKDPDPLIRQGMTASARIITREIENALVVPIEAVIRRSGKTGVVTAPDAAFVAVEVIAQGDHAAAIEGSVAPGTRVFLRDPAQRLREGLGTGTPVASEDSAGPSTVGGAPPAARPASAPG